MDKTAQDRIISNVRITKQGNLDGLGALYEMFKDDLYRSCHRLLKDEESTKDVVQTSFITAFEKIDSLKTESSFGFWLRRIGINECLKLLRKNEPKSHLNDIEGSVSTEDDCDSTWWELIEWGDLQQLIDNLPLRCKTVFILFAIEDLSHKDIADTMKITESTSKTQYRRAKELLRSEVLSKFKING